MSLNNPINPPAEDAIQLARKHLEAILNLSLQHTQDREAIVVYDELCPLAVILTAAYRRVLPSAKFIDFYAHSPETVKEAFKALNPLDLVVTIQSSSFRMDAFRMRVELFKDSLKVIEHPHLGRMIGQEIQYYLESLAYDAAYYRNTGLGLKKLIDQASQGSIDSGGEQLKITSAFETAKLNIGDYSEMKNIGGQFPIGEVFTEAKDLEAVNGRVRIYAFADTTFSVNVPEKPITLVVTRGRITEALDSTPELEQVFANIRADEGEVWLREIGFGLNRAFSPERRVTDIGTFERVCGIHLSLGAKHGIYNKPQFKRATTWHHVDVFAVTEAVTLDTTLVYNAGAWRV